MSDRTEYRIEFSVQRRHPAEDDFSEIGFGSSGGCQTIDQASHMAASAIETYEWETLPGMPDPEDIRTAVESLRY